MDKIKIGIPRSLFYYYDGYLLKNFFEYLDFDVVISPETNKSIVNEGIKYSNDEMCLSLKIFLGHISYLKDKCDYILTMRIDNYGRFDQTCTNFLSLYDIVNNLFDVNLLNINIDYLKSETMYKGLKEICKHFHIPSSKIKKAYESSLIKTKKHNKNLEMINTNKLYKEGLKILLVSHSYNSNDKYIGKPIVDYLEKNKVNVILSNNCNKKVKDLSYKLCPNLYWIYNKENIGNLINLYNKIDGIIFLSSFPCGPDSLVNELVIRKIKKPYLNLIVDDLDSLTGIETRLESFIDILEQRV